MSFFSADYIDFFTELAFNNEKSWFDANRKRYEQNVREPFKAFTEHMISELQKLDSSIGPLEPKDVMFRINRDLRFSKDKTPYNTWLSAAIVKGGKRSEEGMPAYYYRFAVDGVQIGGGMYGPSKDKLLEIRRKIMNDPKSIHKVADNPKFKELFGEINGEENKVIPKEFKEVAASEPLIKKKSFTFWREYPEQEVLRDDLDTWLLEHFKVGKKLNDFLR